MEVVWKTSNGSQLNIFDVHNTMLEAGIAIPEARPIFRDPSQIVVKGANKDEVESLLAVDSVNGNSITAHILEDRNTSKCIIKCPSIAGLDPARILAEMRAQGVKQVEAKGNAGTFVLTFDTKPPKSVKVGPLRVLTQTFVPRPILCRKCFCYGHTKEECKNKGACTNCGRDHAGRCPGQPKCCNCGGKHLPTWGGCPVWRQELSIRRIAVAKGISGQAARILHKKKKKEYIPLRRGTAAEPEEGVAGPSGTATPQQRTVTVVLESDTEDSAIPSEAEKPKKKKLKKVKKAQA